MRTYMVSCDFRGDVVAESALSGELNRYSGIRFKHDAWLIRTDAPQDDVWEGITSVCPDGAYILMTEIEGSIRMRQAACIAGWIKKNCTA